MQIYNGLIDNPNPLAKGGTELLAERLHSSVPQELLKEFQIVISRQTAELDETKLRIYWSHDLASDPEAHRILSNNGWDRFHKLVFVSNWQMQTFISTYNIPWSKCVVIQNGIEPIFRRISNDDNNETIKLGYWSTPHRGLDILVPVFKKLCEKYDNLELTVFSSFKLYGWDEKDKEFENLLGSCENNPKINYFGIADNKTVRNKIKDLDILAYPNTWPETSCMVLMEAMASGLMCVHSNLAALSETAANWTLMYQFHEDKAEHAKRFYHILDHAIQNYNTDSWVSKRLSQQTYANVFYNWNSKAEEWKALLSSLIAEPREFPKEMFVLRT